MYISLALALALALSISLVRALFLSLSLSPSLSFSHSLTHTTLGGRDGSTCAFRSAPAAATLVYRAKLPPMSPPRTLPYDYT